MEFIPRRNVYVKLGILLTLLQPTEADLSFPPAIEMIQRLGHCFMPVVLKLI